MLAILNIIVSALLDYLHAVALFIIELLFMMLFAVQRNGLDDALDKNMSAGNRLFYLCPCTMCMHFIVVVVDIAAAMHGFMLIFINIIIIPCHLLLNIWILVYAPVVL